MIIENIIILYLITGALAGLLAGLLGIGGGIIVVPMLSMIFRYQNFSDDQIMHIAIGTSLAIMIFTSMSAAYAYSRKKLIVWPLFYKFSPGLLLGTITGAIIATQFSSHDLKIAFAIFIIALAIFILWQKHIVAKRELPNIVILTFAAFIIGSFSGFFGIGGGSLIVPFFIYCQIEMHKATGTSSLCGLPVAIIGTISFMIIGWHSVEGLLGYVYLPAAVTVAVTALICAPIGAKFAILLPSQILKKIFAVMLILTAVNLLTHQ